MTTNTAPRLTEDHKRLAYHAKATLAAITKCDGNPANTPARDKFLAGSRKAFEALQFIAEGGHELRPGCVSLAKGLGKQPNAVAKCFDYDSDHGSADTTASDDEWDAAHALAATKTNPELFEMFKSGNAFAKVAACTQRASRGGCGSARDVGIAWTAIVSPPPAPKPAAKAAPSKPVDPETRALVEWNSLSEAGQERWASRDTFIRVRKRELAAKN